MVHDRQVRRRWLDAALIAAGCFGCGANAEIFRCVAVNGLPLYQNFPCQFDSLGAMGLVASIRGGTAPAPSATYAAAHIGSSPASVTGMAREGSMLAPAGSAAQSVPFDVSVAVRMAGESEPRVGMTPDEIRTLLGEPVEIIQDEPLEQGPAQSWRYVDRQIRFDSQRRVVTVEKF